MVISQDAGTCASLLVRNTCLCPLVLCEDG